VELKRVRNRDGRMVAWSTNQAITCSCRNPCSGHPLHVATVPLEGAPAKSLGRQATDHGTEPVAGDELHLAVAHAEQPSLRQARVGGAKP
jgi:hypothetical protein